jgi:molybdopterin synthase catalytic subunit
MRVRVLLFAAARERAGGDELYVDLVEPTRARDVLAAVVGVAPGLSAIAGQLRVAINQCFVDGDATVGPGDEVALLPPVSGGAGRFARVTREPLSLERVVSAVRDDQDGAVATFSGVVRNHSDGQRVHRLDYEAYLPMAERILADLCDELEGRHAVRIAIEHRIGSLAVGELAVVIAVGAPHRREALAACGRMIDRVKTDVPLWKREHTDTGARWVGCAACALSTQL